MLSDISARGSVSSIGTNASRCRGASAPSARSTRRAGRLHADGGRIRYDSTICTVSGCLGVNFYKIQNELILEFPTKSMPSGFRTASGPWIIGGNGYRNQPMLPYPYPSPTLPRERGRVGGRCLLDRPVKPGDDSVVESRPTEDHDVSAR